MKLLEIDENEVKEGKGLKVLTPNKLLTRLPIYTNQKIKSVKYCIFAISIKKSLKKVYNNFMKSL